MRRMFTMVALMSTFLFGACLLDAVAQGAKGAKAVQGSWSQTKGTAKITLAFAGDKFTLTKSRDDKKETINGTFKVDPSKTPHTIDMTVTDGTSRQVEKYKGKTSLGIYKVDGDKLQWCANEPGKDGRPAAFPNEDGDKTHLYLTFERDKK
ncbi:MAG: TIGR03067 domain-containing protein [Planctomycetes bacterium]|nr:TIGR03067 domain-containing protein [Planctomycetota bacterium]